MNSAQFDADVDPARAEPSRMSAGANHDGRGIHAAAAAVVGLLVHVLNGTPSARRDDRGLSQSTENAILLAGAAAIALTIITVITAYVKQRLPK